MKIYLVGGAVRDELLGLPVKERDWVVVGSTPHEMLSRKFQPVGKDFPVFLHPKTHEEYALARTERKTGKGYTGFQFHADPDVTLEDDLKRRDLTINAMAKTEDGELIDPYGGQADLKTRTFHHVSPAFSEDPVRILRVARFAAQLPEFHVHKDTNVLMQTMVKNGEVNALVAERVWKEFVRALKAKAPTRFFEVLSLCDALPALFPELHHTPFSTDVFTRAIANNQEAVIRFAVLLSHLPLKTIQHLCQRYRVPSEFSELATLIAKHYVDYKNCDANNAEQLWDILKQTDAFRRPERFTHWLRACESIDSKTSKKQTFLNALAAAKSVDTKPLLAQGYEGKAFAEALKQLQIEAIK